MQLLSYNALRNIMSMPMTTFGDVLCHTIFHNLPAYLPCQSTANALLADTAIDELRSWHIQVWTVKLSFEACLRDSILVMQLYHREPNNLKYSLAVGHWKCAVVSSWRWKMRMSPSISSSSSLSTVTVRSSRGSIRLGFTSWACMPTHTHTHTYICIHTHTHRVLVKSSEACTRWVYSSKNNRKSKGPTRLGFTSWAHACARTHTHTHTHTEYHCEVPWGLSTRLHNKHI